jgi:hypothetical protein
MKISFIFLLLAFILQSVHVHAHIDRTIIIKGKLTKFDKTKALVETETGAVQVPSQSVKAMQYRTGQTVLIYVDIIDFISMNEEKLKKHAILKAEGADKIQYEKSNQ